MGPQAQWTTQPEYSLRPMLQRWASQYSSDWSEQHRLVEQTVFLAPDELSLNPDQPIDQVLFRLMHRLALDQPTRKLRLD
jgi:hypothetical protein